MTQAGFLSADIVNGLFVQKTLDIVKQKGVNLSLFVTCFTCFFLSQIFVSSFFQVSTIFNTDILQHQLIIILNKNRDSHREMFYKNSFSANNCSTTQLLSTSQKHWKMPMKEFIPLQKATRVLTTNENNNLLEHLVIIFTRLQRFTKVFKEAK